MKRHIAVLFMVLAVGVMASAGGVFIDNVQYDTITDALKAAQPGASIRVTPAYDGAGEDFPILVQKDNVRIWADGNVTVGGEDVNDDGDPVFVVGAHRVFNEDPDVLDYVYRDVTGVTIEGFTIVGPAAIGIVVKEASFATIAGNTILGDEDDPILEGIRLVAVSNSKVVGNTISEIGAYDDDDGVFTGIGINVELSSYNTLRDNTVTDSGLGLFMFKSSRNGVEGDTYVGNAFGGVVLNDTAENALSNLTVTDNVGWGVRFVHAFEDSLTCSVVTYNLGGGVQLIASQKSTVDGNLVASNGDPDATTTATDDFADAVQIAVVPGDKALFESPVVDALNTLRDPDGNLITKPLSDFVLEKHQVEEKLDLLEWWLHDLNRELRNIHQRLLSGSTSDAAAAGRELEAILRTPGVLTGNPITRIEVYGDQNVTPPVPPVVDLVHGMGDPRYNFTWWDVVEYGGYDPTDTNQHPFDEQWDLLSVAKLDFYSGRWLTPADYSGQTPSNIVNSFGLTRGFNDPLHGPLGAGTDRMTWDKVGIIHIIIEAIGNELDNDFETDGYAWDHEKGRIELPTGYNPALPWNIDHIDSLREKLDHWDTLGLIDGATYDDLSNKLTVVENLLVLVDLLFDNIVDVLAGTHPTYYDFALYTHVWGAIKVIDGYKAEIFAHMDHMRHKLALIDLELAPLLHINSDLVGKKEKPFDAITDGSVVLTDDEIAGMITRITTGGTTPGAVPAEIFGALANIYSTLAARDFIAVLDDAVVADQLGRMHSRKNVISSNIITSDVLVEGNNIGIVVASPENIIVNNLITNEGLPELDEYLRNIEVGDDPIYERVYRMDIGILLLANDCLITYNAFEFLDWGIKRGGKWVWEDYQLEYVFTKLATVAYWPGPGEVLELERYTSEEWRERGMDPEKLEPGDKYYPPTVTVDYLPVLRLRDDYNTVSIDRTVAGNRISLNFFDHGGVGIDIEKAHSNVIDENLFYQLVTANIRFRAGSDGAGVDIRHNDHFGGVAISAATGIEVDARRDYTDPEGNPGHAKVVGAVTPPAAPEPFAYENFLTLDKFIELEGWIRSKLGGMSVNLQQYQWQGLPPNEEFFCAVSVTLPDQKPRHPRDIPFVIVDDIDWTKRTFGPGIHMLSVPSVPEDDTPMNVFRAAVADDVLVMREYKAGAYVMPTEINPGRGYWIYLFDEATIEVPRELPDGTSEVELAETGWHQVSTPKWSVGWQTVTFMNNGDEKTLAQAITADWIEPLAFFWSVELGEYRAIELPGTQSGMDPWRAYFLKTKAPGLTMVLQLDEPHFPGAPETSLSMSQVPARLQPPSAPTLNTLVAGLLTSMSYPNPVAQGQATFRAAGLPVEEVRVTVLDLGGRKVWQAGSTGNQLSWNLTDSAGRSVANGLYLYFMEAKVGGQWVTTKVDRLLIVR